MTDPARAGLTKIAVKRQLEHIQKNPSCQVKRDVIDQLARRYGVHVTQCGLEAGVSPARDTMWGVGCRPYFTPPTRSPIYRAEFGSKEGDFHVTEFAEFAEAAGRISIAIPFHNHLRVPGAEEIDCTAGLLERALGEV